MKGAAVLWLVSMALWAQVQPIPFEHKQHAALGLKCAECHATPDPGEVVTFPTASKCMLCHGTIKTDTSSIQNLKHYAETKQEVPWVRVYQIPSWVYFNHKVHAERGATCENCHGPVAQRSQLVKETDLSMGGCMSCHKARKASLDCAACHEAKS